MRQIVSSIIASSMLAALGLGQPVRPAHQLDGPASRPDPLVYVLTNNPQNGAVGFGAAQLGSGAFVPIGPALPPDLGHALAPATGAALLSLAFSGNLYSIDARTGVTTLVGPTGLGDCTTPASPCPPNSAVTIGLFNGKYYALDFSQNLYSLNPVTGRTKLIGPTGMPQINVPPLSIDSNGKLRVNDENLFTFRGKLYANFDAGDVDLTNGSETAVIPDAIYEINPDTGNARMVALTDLGLLTIFNVNEAIYAFDSINDRFVLLDPGTGSTQPVSNLDPSTGFVCGATPARPMPEARR